MKSIFNEDIDLDEELEDEELEEQEEVVEPAQLAPIEEVVQPVQVQPQVTQVPVQPVQVQPVAPQPRSESFADLSIDDVNSPEADIMRPRPYKYDRRKLKKVGQRTQPEEEYSAVLSPIFGNTSDEEKDYRKIHNAINLEKPVDDPDFVQVISPMFGSNVAGNIPTHSIPKMDPDLNVNRAKKKVETKEVSVSSVVETKDSEVVQTTLFTEKD